MFELSRMVLYLCVSRLLRPNFFGSLRSRSKAVCDCIHTLFYAVISFLTYRLEVIVHRNSQIPQTPTATFLTRYFSNVALDVVAFLSVTNVTLVMNKLIWLVVNLLSILSGCSRSMCEHCFKVHKRQPTFEL